jgi:hypothetical protein
LVKTKGVIGNFQLLWLKVNWIQGKYYWRVMFILLPRISGSGTSSKGGI